MESRFAKCAEKTKLSKHALAIEAIEAAVEAIEANDYRLVVPIAFTVTHVPVESSKTGASATGGERPAARVGARSTGSTPARKDDVAMVAEQGSEYRASRKPSKSS